MEVTPKTDMWKGLLEAERQENATLKKRVEELKTELAVERADKLAKIVAAQERAEKAEAALANMTTAHCEAMALVLSHEGHIETLGGELARLKEAVESVNDLINNSYGIAGLHLNGDVAPWNELLRGGRFESWLLKFDIALDSLNLNPKEEGK